VEPSGQPSANLRSEVLLQILEVTRRLAAPFDLPDVLAEIGEAARRVLRAERTTIWLYDAESSELVLAGEPGAAPLRASVERGILGLTARRRAIVNVPDCRVEPLFDPEVDLDYDHDVRCMLSVPLVDQGALVGVLQVVDRSDGPFTHEDVRIAETLAAQCVVFIQRERISRTLISAERLDPRSAREIQMNAAVEMPRLTVTTWPAASFGRLDGGAFDLVHRRWSPFAPCSATPGSGLRQCDTAGMLRVVPARRARPIFAQVNNRLVEDLPDEHFVTAFVGLLDADRHHVEFHSAGQGPLLHYRAAEHRCEWLPPTTFPLGFIRFPDLQPPQRLDLAPGDILGLISDGVFESEDAAQRMFGRRCH
jgi:phosphoserine phosphatase